MKTPPLVGGRTLTHPPLHSVDCSPHFSELATPLEDWFKTGSCWVRSERVTRTVAVGPRSVDGPCAVPLADKLVVGVVTSQLVALTTVDSARSRVEVAQRAADERAIRRRMIGRRQWTRRIYHQPTRHYINNLSATNASLHQHSRALSQPPYPAGGSDPRIKVEIRHIRSWGQKCPNGVQRASRSKAPVEGLGTKKLVIFCK